MAGRLHDKVAIITGGATGVGEAVAHKFAREGARIVVAGLPDDPVDDVVQALTASGFEAVGYSGDLAIEPDALACIQTALDRFGRIDVLINNAGVFLATGETQDYPIDAFDATIRNNIRPAFLMTKFALPHLHKTRGNIVFTGSEAGKLGEPMNTPYGGTKAWAHAFAQGVAVEQAPHGVRANCVCPGPIDTAWTHTDSGPMSADMEKMTVESVAMGRRGTVEEMANVFAFLASDEASFVTGALWSVDGGVTVAKGSVGAQVPDDLRREPAGTLPLRHTHDGLRNKDVRRSAA